MNALDLVLSLLLAYSAYRGYNKGLLNTLFSFVAFFTAVVAAVKLMSVVATILTDYFTSSFRVVALVSFALTFLIVYIAIYWSMLKIKHLLNYTIIGRIDNLAGAVLSVIKSMILLSLLLWAASMLKVAFINKYASGSVLYPYLLHLLPMLFEQVNHILPVYDWLNIIKKNISNH
ncbi:MAG: CvpA family protein [Cytophagaceae bacterium]|nr:CvpA family protein [Cytophagaceae bacterium]MDW8457109.1 CvpA family protein [Cytophagaceae bacterium]